MTKLTIHICTEDDEEALRVLNRLRNMMDVCSGEDCGIHLNDAGYTSSHVDGNGEVRVIRINDADGRYYCTCGKVWGPLPPPWTEPDAQNEIDRLNAQAKEDHVMLAKLGACIIDLALNVSKAFGGVGANERQQAVLDRCADLAIAGLFKIDIDDQTEDQP